MEADEHDYYSYKPLVRLDRPVAIVGLPGSNPVQTTRVVTMLTGLEAVLLPRRVAHAVGMDPEGLLLGHRDDELHAAELVEIERALAKRSPPVIALGPQTLQDPACAAALRKVMLVHLRQTVSEALDAIQRDMATDPRKHQHLNRYGPISEANLGSMFRERTERYSKLAEIEVVTLGRGPLSVGRELPDLIAPMS